jgi:hypothetical protein
MEPTERAFDEPPQYAQAMLIVAPVGEVRFDAEPA